MFLLKKKMDCLLQIQIAKGLDDRRVQQSPQDTGFIGLLNSN